MSHPYENIHAALQFALVTGSEVQSFLSAWTHGEWDVLDREWPEWKVFLDKFPKGVPDWPIDTLIDEFAEALKQKAFAAQEKYGYHPEGWKEDNWEHSCRRGMFHHIDKGDPRDVAIYLAFMWHHKWSTKPQSSDELEPKAAEQPLTLADVAAIFGDTMPISVVNVIQLGLEPPEARVALAAIKSTQTDAKRNGKLEALLEARAMITAKWHKKVRAVELVPGSGLEEFVAVLLNDIDDKYHNVAIGE